MLLNPTILFIACMFFMYVRPKQPTNLKNLVQLHKFLDLSHDDYNGAFKLTLLVIFLSTYVLHFRKIEAFIGA